VVEGGGELAVGVCLGEEVARLLLDAGDGVGTGDGLGTGDPAQRRRAEGDQLDEGAAELGRVAGLLGLRSAPSNRRQ